jgi:ribosomal protein RSM22 (predicted rRNA methylase)
VQRRRRTTAIHDGLVGARELIGKAYLADPELRQQYARDIAPRTEAALGRILDEVWRSEETSPARALDLGAGTGAVGRALRARFGDATEVVAVDRVAGPGIMRANLAVELPALEGRFELIVAAHLLNELFVNRNAADRLALRSMRVLAWAQAFLSPRGLLVLIEPALRETSRELLGVRDELLRAGLHVVAPCLWQGRCPALAAERDWCHDAAPVASHSRVDFSYVVLSAEGITATPGFERVVSDPLRDKGRLRLFVCGAEGRRELVRLNRHRTPANAPLDGAARGDLLSVADAEGTPTALRIKPETSVGVRQT